MPHSESSWKKTATKTKAQPPLQRGEKASDAHDLVVAKVFGTAGTSSVANDGLFPAKWLILKIFGGQKKWLISHQNVAYFQPFKWLILSLG